jgi:hypothetical protein
MSQKYKIYPALRGYRRTAFFGQRPLYNGLFRTTAFLVQRPFSDNGLIGQRPYRTTAFLVQRPYRTTAPKIENGPL